MRARSIDARSMSRYFSSVPEVHWTLHPEVSDSREERSWSWCRHYRSGSNGVATPAFAVAPCINRAWSCRIAYTGCYRCSRTDRLIPIYEYSPLLCYVYILLLLPSSSPRSNLHWPAWTPELLPTTPNCYRETQAITVAAEWLLTERSAVFLHCWQRHEMHEVFWS